MREHSNQCMTLSNWPGLLANVIRYQSFHRFTYMTPWRTPILVTFYNESRNGNLKTPQLHACWMFWVLIFSAIGYFGIDFKIQRVCQIIFWVTCCWMNFSDNLIWSRAATCLSVHQTHLNLKHLVLIWQFLFDTCWGSCSSENWALFFFSSLVSC